MQVKNMKKLEPSFNARHQSNVERTMTTMKKKFSIKSKLLMTIAFILLVPGLLSVPFRITHLKNIFIRI